MAPAQRQPTLKIWLRMPEETIEVHSASALGVWVLRYREIGKPWALKLETTKLLVICPTLMHLDHAFLGV